MSWEGGNDRKGRTKLRSSSEYSIKNWHKRVSHEIRKSIEPREVVLAYNRTLESLSRLLLRNIWNEPYRVPKQINKGPYEIEELDGTKLARIFSAIQIKWLYPRGYPADSSLGDEDKELEEEEIEEENAREKRNKYF
ncbi:hypothetical protein O181_110221 [Austropuccinia psidii MF-1]|uniref:Uncharacterized protein n=1 Tax=Austropuccinia psidii MF-1 TaxID=1389203 RepID=A0A9Q3JYR6_9BASI|nr:hypothetical protein [Austropuccinia psidii MF-1]